jgi:Zn-finger nucleic acid-binding protein
MSSNIAGQTRDESQTLNCPKCKASMEKLAFAGTTVDRCVSCKGLWFDASEREHLKDLEGSEAIDNGTAAKAPPPPPPPAVPSGPAGKILCPVCRTPMIAMTDHLQPHLKFESCTVCYGVFFDAGEFRDYKELTIAETVRSLFKRQ